MVSRTTVKIDSLLAFVATATVASAQQGWNAYPQAPVASQAPWAPNAWFPNVNAMWAGYAQPIMRGKALVAADADADAEGNYATYSSRSSSEPTETEEPSSEPNSDVYSSDEVLPTSETNNPVYSGSVAESSEYASSTKCETAAPITVTKTETKTQVSTVTQAPLPAVTVTETSILTITNVITQTVGPSSEHPGYSTVAPTSEKPVYPTVAPTSEKPVYPTVAPTSEKP
ncbi:hypothetical protein LPJ73_005232, partial [Coemansia sp. RSA 2703]